MDTGSHLFSSSAFCLVYIREETLRSLWLAPLNYLSQVPSPSIVIVKLAIAFQYLGTNCSGGSYPTRCLTVRLKVRSDHCLSPSWRRSSFGSRSFHVLSPNLDLIWIHFMVSKYSCSWNRKRNWFPSVSWLGQTFFTRRRKGEAYLSSTECLASAVR